MTFQNELSFLDSFLSTAAKKKKCLFCLYTLQNEMIQLYSTMVPYMILLSFLIFFFCFFFNEHGLLLYFLQERSMPQGHMVWNI